MCGYHFYIFRLKTTILGCQSGCDDLLKLLFYEIRQMGETLKYRFVMNNHLPKIKGFHFTGLILASLLM